MSPYCKPGKCRMEWHFVQHKVWALACLLCGRVERHGDELDAPRSHRETRALLGSREAARTFALDNRAEL